MRKQLPVYLMSSLSVLAALTAKPAPAADTLDFVEQETQVFAASRYVQTLAQTPANVTIISADELRRFGFRTISEALQTLPGVYDAASQWPGLGFRGVAIPGDFGSRILYLINGMPIYEPTYGGFFIEHLDIATIKRIEVVRGPGSALYGSGAVLAVVNLVTRTGHDYPNARLWGEAGSHGFRKGYASISGVSASGVDGFASVSANERDGRDFYLREYDSPLTNNGLSIGNDASDGSRFFGRLSRQMSRGQTWLQAHYVEQDRSDPLASYSTVFNTDRLRLDEWFASVEAGTQQYLFGGQVTARGYYQGFSETGDYPYNRNVPQTGGLIQFLDATDFRSDQFGAELRYERGFASGSRLLGGLEVKRIETHHVDGETSGPFRDGAVDVDWRPRYNLHSLFFQDEIPVGASGTLFLGGRYDFYQNFSPSVRARFSPRLAYVHQFSEFSTGKLVYGEAFRAPTIYESLFQDGEPAADTLWRNPDLKPQVSRWMEALWETLPQPGWRVNTGVFAIQIENAPVLVDTPTLNGLDCMRAACNQYRNAADSLYVVGVESGLRISNPGGVLAYASLSLQRARQGSEELTASPDYVLKAGIASPILGRLLDVSVDASYVGGTPGWIDGPGLRSAGTSPYLLLNLGLHRSFSRARISLRASNLLDKNIFTIASRELTPLARVPLDGRNFSLQVSLDL